MNKSLTYILVGGASALIGAVAGYFFCKKQMQDKFDDELSNAINKELESIRNLRTRDHIGDDAVDGDAPPASHEGIYNKAVEAINSEFPDADLNPYRVSLIAREIADVMSDDASEEEISDYILKKIEEFESEEDDEIDEPQQTMEEWADRDPYVISNEEYRRLPPYFEFLTFHYFQDDDVLIDDKEEVVDDVEGVVGDALLHFGEEPDDGDCVYVVNGRFGDAIEINRLHTSYAGWAGWGSML